jgi:ankyrin repeat protein
VDYTNGSWILTDANYLEEGEKECNNKEVAQLLLTAYSSPFIFSTRAFTTSNKIESLNQSLTALKENLTWNELHGKMTKKQISQKDSSGHTLFYVAAVRGDLEMVKQCITLGGTCNPEGQKAATPFFIAAQDGHLEVVKMLLQEFGNDKEKMNQATNEGVTPLWIAAKNGHLEIVEILIQELGNDKEKVNQPSYQGITPLWAAASKGRLKIVKMLIQVLENDKEKINQPMNQGATPLWAAAQNDHFATVKLLIQALGNDKEKINQPAHNGATPLFVAAQKGHIKIVKVLIDALGNDKEKINQPINQGATPLFAAGQNGHLAVVKVLIKALANDQEKINQPLQNTTPLFAAAEHGYLEIVKVLVQALGNDKEQINKPSNQGATALYVAAQNGHLETVKALIQALGNDKEQINKPANNGATALSIAKQKGHAAIVKILSEALESDQKKMNQPVNCPNLASSNLNLENEFKFINDLLDEYRTSRSQRFWIKDRLSSKDKKERELFIDTYFSNKEHFIALGKDGLLEVIENGIKKFPGLHFKTVLHNIALRLLDEASSQEEHSDKAKEILEQQKSTYPQYIEKIKRLYEQIESINHNTTNLTIDDAKKVSALSIQLKKDLDFLIIQHPTQLPNETAFNQFKSKFNHRLHSEDIIMSQQENWNSFALNLFLGVITLGIVLGIKAIHSKLTTDHMTLFARKTKKQEHIDTLQDALVSVYALY